MEFRLDSENTSDLTSSLLGRMAGNEQSWPPAGGNGDIIQVCQGVHLVEGTTFMRPFFSFPRTMTILETGLGELVLVNAIRLEDAQEAELVKIGSVKHVIRIGLHDRDTAYYKEKFGAAVYGYRTAEYQNGVVPDHNIDDGALPPLRNLQVIPLPNLPKKSPECALLVDGKILITCDAIQDHVVPRGNFLTRVVLPFMGFKGKGIVGPAWKTHMEKEMGDSRFLLRRDMLELTKFNYEHLISGHGYIVDGTAKAAVDASIKATFPAPP